MPSLTQITLLAGLAYAAYKFAKASRKDQYSRTEDFFIQDATAPTTLPIGNVEYHDQLVSGSLKNPDGSIGKGQFF